MVSGPFGLGGEHRGDFCACDALGINPTPAAVRPAGASAYKQTYKQEGEDDRCTNGT